jgi:hypothetical protein
LSFDDAWSYEEAKASLHCFTKLSRLDIIDDELDGFWVGFKVNYWREYADGAAR